MATLFLTSAEVQHHDGVTEVNPVHQLLGGLTLKDFTFQECLTTKIICGICRSKSATPLSEVRYLSASTLEEELLLAIEDPMRAQSVGRVLVCLTSGVLAQFRGFSGIIEVPW